MLKQGVGIRKIIVFTIDVILILSLFIVSREVLSTSSAGGVSAPPTGAPLLFSTDAASQYPGAYITSSGVTTSGVSPFIGVPQTAPAVQGFASQSYMLYVPSSGSVAVPPPSCPVGYVQQIYVSPTSYVGPNLGPGISPIYGMYAYAEPVCSSGSSPLTIANTLPCTANGVIPTGRDISQWNVGLYMLNGVQGTWGMQAGYVMVYVQCCNPQAPNANGCLS